MTQQQQSENAEHQVMNVATGHHDEMERGDLVRDPEKTAPLDRMTGRTNQVYVRRNQMESALTAGRNGK